MNAAVEKILAAAKVICEVQVPSAKACADAHWSLFKTERLDRHELGDDLFDYASALRLACLGYHTVPAGLRGDARGVIYGLSRIVTLLANPVKEA